MPAGRALRPRSPRALLIATCAIVAVTEGMVMLSLDMLWRPASPWLTTMLDVLLLTAIAGPLIFLLFARDRAAQSQWLSTALSAKEAEVRGLHEDLIAQRHAFDQHSIVAITDRRGTILQVNDLATEITGYAREELIGQNHRILNSGTHPPEFFAALWRTITRGEAWRGEICNRRKDGSLYWVDSTIVPMLDDSGRPRSYVSIRTDITWRRKAEELMRQSEQRQARALAGAELGAWELDLVTGDASYDARWCAMLGYDTTEIEGRSDSWARLTHPDDVIATRNALQRHLAGEAEGIELELRMRHRDGHWVWVLTRGRVMSHDDDGTPRRLAGTHADITRRVLAAAAQHAANEAAAAAVRARTEFLAVMSHEIRTPMNAVLGFIDLLLQSELSAEQHDHAEIVRQAGEHLLAVINDILDFSKIEAGQLQLERTWVDVRVLIDGTLAMLHPLAAAADLALGFDVDADVPSAIWADELRIRQVLMNLVGNAIKFTEHGSVLVHVRRDAGDGASGIRVSVTDTGIGIDAAQQGKLFNAFVQADATTARRFGGSGLGLAIARRLVEAHGGTISLVSAHGAGSTFSFHLPAASPALVASSSSAAAGGATVASNTARTRKDVTRPPHVLVAEDVDVNRRLIVAMLTRLGCQVDTVADGAAAVGACADVPYDLVLMDCRMPVMDGLEATRSIRASAGADSHVPIVALTASAMEADRKACIAAGMDDYLSKPIDRRRLAVALERWAGPAPRLQPTVQQAGSPS